MGRGRDGTEEICKPKKRALKACRSVLSGRKQSREGNEEEKSARKEVLVARVSAVRPVIYIYIYIRIYMM